jgi:hypothetical protein
VSLRASSCAVTQFCFDKRYSSGPENRTIIKTVETPSFISRMTSDAFFKGSLLNGSSYSFIEFKRNVIFCEEE